MIAGRSGDAFYISPEMALNRPHGKSSDIWSAGVLLHILLSGTQPFLGTGESLRYAICSGELHVMTSSYLLTSTVCLFCIHLVCLPVVRCCGSVQFDAPVWAAISDHAKDLLQQLLCVDPNDRLSVHEALEHRWLKVTDAKKKS